MNTIDTRICERAQRELAMSVLKQAAQDLRRFRGAVAAVEREIYLDAYSWVASDDCSWPFSFSNVCRVLDHEPFRLREELLSQQSLGILGQLARRGTQMLHRFSDSVRRRSATDHNTRTATSPHLLQTSY